MRNKKIDVNRTILEFYFLKYITKYPHEFLEQIYLRNILIIKE